MSAPANAGTGKPTLRIRGRSYPVLLPSIRDPRLHLAAVIISLQVLGQVAFDFRLSIAQILVSLLTCAVLEMGIAFRRQHVILWPASALLTGNGVAFILRVPGTEHGDWWSMNGWWIFAGTAAVSLLSKYLIKFRGGHIFNPSNFGLVLCFLLLGPEHADPLEFWWGPMTPWLALAIAIIVTGGLAILLRLRLLGIAIGFWVTFVASIAVLAASGHAMTARWHLGPVSDWYFWQVLAFSPEILVFLFFMITDPKTIPAGKVGRRVYAVAIGLLAALLAAPQTTEFATKVAVLSSLFIVCAARPLIIIFLDLARARGLSGLGLSALVARRAAVGAAALVGAVASRAARRRRRPGPFERGRHDSRRRAGERARRGHDRPLGRAGADRPPHGAGDRAGCGRRSRDRVGRPSPPRPRPRNGGSGRRPAGSAVAADPGREGRVRSSCRTTPSNGPASPWSPATARRRRRSSPRSRDGRARDVLRLAAHGPASRRPGALLARFELTLADGRYLIVAASGTPEASSAPAPIRSEAFGGVQLQDVAAQVGLDFTQCAFRFGVTDEPEAMMGGGLCWIDYDDDGWLDLFVVNAYADDEYDRWTEKWRSAPQRALPQRARPIRGREPRLGRGPAAPGQRLRRCRLQPGRQRGPLRDDRGLQRRHQRVRRAALGTRRRHLHGRRARSRDQRPGLALRRRGRRT